MANISNKQTLKNELNNDGELIMTNKLEIKDKRILKELDLNARQSNSQIAKKAKLSKNIVNYRINRLEQIGLINGYNTIFDYSRLGYFMVRVFMDFYELDIEKEEDLIQYLVNEKSTGRITKTVGNWDLLVSFYVKDVNEFSIIWKKFIVKHRGIIKEYNTNFVTKGIFFRRAYLLGEKKDISDVSWKRGSSTVEDIDEVDLKIIHMLTKNARTPIEKMATATGLGSMAVIYRIKQLIKKKIITGYRVDINFDKLGYSYYKINLELEDTSITKSLIEFCHQHPNIISIVESISDNVDFEFNMEAKNFDVFLEIIEELKKQFPRKIRNYKYVRLLKNYKNMYMPL
jgi:DNA-binding Lrp family transcriptional regulator